MRHKIKISRLPPCFSAGEKPRYEVIGCLLLSFGLMPLSIHAFRTYMYIRYLIQWIFPYPKWLGPTLFQICEILICTYNYDIVMGTCTYIHVDKITTASQC